MDDTYERAIDRLVRGTVNRLVIRERGHDSVDTRQLLRHFFVELLLTRGWDLGAAFAARRMPEDVDVREIMAHVANGTGINKAQTDALRRSVEDLLTRPDDAEATLLSELGRLSFGLELLVQSPKGIEFFESALPERIYLDANVLMPAITTGHPQKVALEATISTLQNYLKGSTARVSICVFDGFLNEIVSHRRLAINAMSQRDGEGALWAEREVSLLGSEHVNVYIGAYFNLRYLEPDLSFEDFLTRYAPYKNEDDLRDFLHGLGYKIVTDNFGHRRDSDSILHALEVFYATGLEYQRKSAKVIAHDAAQLSLLSYEMHANQRSLFVSADRGLRTALDQSGFAWLGNAIITHLGLIQFVDLLCGKSDDSRSIASLYWMCSVSSSTERIRNHLIALALRQYDAAMALELKNIVDEISEDAGVELERDELKLESENREFPADRAKVNSILGRYEAEFFEKMRKEVERREAMLKRDGD